MGSENRTCERRDGGLGDRGEVQTSIFEALTNPQIYYTGFSTYYEHVLYVA